MVKVNKAYDEDYWGSIMIGDQRFELPEVTNLKVDSSKIANITCLSVLPQPCSRCQVPTINPETGERAGDVQPLIAIRKYRTRSGQGFFGQNAIPMQGAGTLRVGDKIAVCSFKTKVF